MYVYLRIGLYNTWLIIDPIVFDLSTEAAQSNVNSLINLQTEFIRWHTRDLFERTVFRLPW